MPEPIPITPSSPPLAAWLANGHNEDGRTGVAGARGGMIAKMVSGGQTGVDRAALDVALELGIPCGGWCPQGRKAEDGRIPARYPLKEAPTADNATRTRWNVRDADFTLVLSWGSPKGRRRLALREAIRRGKPHALVDLANSDMWPARVLSLRQALAGVAVLNVAGARESSRPGVYKAAKAFLRRLLAVP
jgi:putative molybdenum carrier protein